MICPVSARGVDLRPSLSSVSWCVLGWSNGALSVSHRHGRGWTSHPLTICSGFALCSSLSRPPARMPPLLSWAFVEALGNPGVAWESFISSSLHNRASMSNSMTPEGRSICAPVTSSSRCAGHLCPADCSVSPVVFVLSPLEIGSCGASCGPVWPGCHLGPAPPLCPC